MLYATFLFIFQAGLAVIDEEFSAFDILQNPEKVGQILAKQKPNWTPGNFIIVFSFRFIKYYCPDKLKLVFCHYTLKLGDLKKRGFGKYVIMVMNLILLYM